MHINIKYTNIVLNIMAYSGIDILYVVKSKIKEEGGLKYGESINV